MKLVKRRFLIETSNKNNSLKHEIKYIYIKVFNLAFFFVKRGEDSQCENVFARTRRSLFAPLSFNTDELAIFSENTFLPFANRCLD